MDFTMINEASPSLAPARLRRRESIQQAAPPESIPQQTIAPGRNEKENSEKQARREQELRSGYVNLYVGGATSDASRESPFVEVVVCDRIFRRVNLLGVVCFLWLLLIPSVCAVSTPFDEWEADLHQGKEREAAAVAVYVLVLSLFFVLLKPLGFRLLQSHVNATRLSRWSVILVVAVAIQCFAIVAAIFSDHQKHKHEPDISHSSSY
jgi:hypothetical protein